MSTSQEPATDVGPVRRFVTPGYTPKAATLGQLRQRIDSLDEQIVALLAERALCVRDATRFKRDAFQVAAPERQAAVFSRVERLLNLVPNALDDTNVATGGPVLAKDH